MTAAEDVQTYSRKNWSEVASKLRGDQLSTHPILTTLYAEHRYMGTLLRLLEGQLELLTEGEPVDGRVLYESLHYMTHYPDAFHHPREDLVYQRASELDARLADSVDTLQREHDHLSKIGAEAVMTVSRWQESGEDSDAVQAAVRAYIDTMYRHMTAEESLVFPEIERLLSPADWTMLEQEDLLQPVRDPVFGPRVEREYRNIARKARRALRRGVEDAALVEWIGLEALLEGVEVLFMAGENSKAAAGEHFYAARAENQLLLRDALKGQGLLTLPLRAALNGGSHYVGFLRDLGGIARDAGEDLGELRRSARERLRLALD